jgi:predicted RNA-binding Zn ribbon-like protein
VANHDRSVGLPAAASSSGAPGPALDDVAAALPLRLVVGADGPALAPVQDGVRGALALLPVAVNETVADGTWDRLKICSADDCRWAYLDQTKNRSRAWCEWGCGNKAKTRAYRARKKAAATG